MFDYVKFVYLKCLVISNSCISNVWLCQIHISHMFGYVKFMYLKCFIMSNSYTSNVRLTEINRFYLNTIIEFKMFYISKIL